MNRKPNCLARLTTAFIAVAASTTGLLTTVVASPAAAANIPSEYAFGVYSPAGGPSAGEYEVSGLAPSNQDGMEDVYWAVRDYHSAQERRVLYRMRYDALEDAGPGGGNGLVIDAAIPINVPFDAKDDWEAVTTDEDGNVYIGDTGPGPLGDPRGDDRFVYRLAASQVAGWTSGSLTPTKTWTYKKGTSSAAALTGNVEAMFSIDDQVYLMSRGTNGRVAKLDMAGTALTAVPGAAATYSTLSQVTGTEVSHDGHTMLAITRGNGFNLKSSYIYPRQDQTPLTADQKVVKLLAQFAAGADSTGVASNLEYQSSLEFEGVAFADTGATSIDGTNYEKRRQDDNAYALMVTDLATGGNNKVYRVPAQGFRDGVSCEVTFSQDGIANAGGDRLMVEWDGFDSNDSYSGSASTYIRRAIASETAGGSYYWQGNIGRNVHELEQFVNGAGIANEARYALFPRQDLPGGLTNQDMFIAVPCGEQTTGDSLTCSTLWDTNGDIEVRWNHYDTNSRTYRVYRTRDGGTEYQQASGLTGTSHTTPVSGSFNTFDYRVAVFSGATQVDTADCGTVFDPAGELACDATSNGGTDTVIWDRFEGTDFPGFADASLAKVKVFRRNGANGTWYQQGFFGTNTDTLYEANYGNSFDYRLEVWVDNASGQNPLPTLVTCT